VVGGLGPGPRLLSVERDNGVYLPIPSRDAVKVRLDRLDR
jgi:hypothetical protein